jgi:hypothetical protein
VTNVAWWGPNKLGHLVERRKYAKVFLCFNLQYGPSMGRQLYTLLRLPVSTGQFTTPLEW